MALTTPQATAGLHRQRNDVNAIAAILINTPIITTATIIMLARSEHSLRTAALNCRFQPILSRPVTSSSSSPTPHTQSLIRASRPTSFPSSAPQLSSCTAIRHASTTADSPTAPAQQHLDWNTFFKLRKTRRRLQLGSSVGTTAFGMLGGAQVLAMSDMDKIVSQVPLDPFITLGLITFSCGGLGWLMGPVVGTGIFNTLNRKYIPEMNLVGFSDHINQW